MAGEPRDLYVKVGRKYLKLNPQEAAAVNAEDFARDLRTGGLENLAAIYSSFTELDSGSLTRLDRDIGRLLVNRALKGT